MINTASRRYRVPAGVIAGIIKVETDFNSESASPVGAQGLMSLMPQTAYALGVQNPLDPWQNIAGGSKLLGSYLEYYDGNVSRAIAAYHIGISSVPQTGPLPTAHQTRRYVRSVLREGQLLGYSTTTVKF